MPKYKVLRSVAHNAAHSLMSDMWWADNTYFYEQLYDAARTANQPHVEVDFLSGSIEPESIATQPLLEAQPNIRRMFEGLVSSGGASLEWCAPLA